MNRAFSQTLMRPNLPLRRPATGPSSLAPRSPAPTFHELAQENLLASDMLDGPMGDAVRKENVFSAKNSLNCGDFLSPSQTAGSMVGPLVKLCNYCSHQGNFRCNRCKKTYYCSVACQTQDWKAHRHLCKPSISEVASDKTKESTAIPSENGLGGLQAKEICVDVQPKRMYRRDLRKNVVSKGSEIQGTVIDLRNPGEFSIHLQSVEMMESLKNITTELQKAYSASFAAEYKPEIGELCAVKFSLDRNWYRAEVQSVDVASRVVSVLYIDFGNEENVTLDNIRPLSENIDAAPPFALQCCVAGVKPLTGSWTGECTIAVRQLIAGKSLTFTVLDIMNDGALLAVDVPLSTLGKYMSIFLIEQGYAVKEDVPVKPQIEHDINSLMTASFENFKRLSGGKNENSEARPPESLTQGVGDTFTAIVTHLQSPSEILCQKLENASVIQQLQTNLKEHCSKTPASENFRPAPGTVCCSLFSGDARWYRAMILEVCGEGKARVYFVNYGNSCEVEAAHLKAITPSLLKLPFQAIRCWLEGVEPVEGQWNKEAIHKFQALCAGQPLGGRVLSISEKGYGVELESAGQSIAAMLISEHLAKPYVQVKQPPVQPDKPTSQIEDLPTLKPIDQSPPAEEPLKVNNKGAANDTEVSTSIGSFPLNWKTLELSCTDTFQPRVAAVISPSLFYIMNPGQVNVEGLKAVMTDVAKYCSKQPIPNQCHPLPGAACCAQFSEVHRRNGAVHSVVTSIRTNTNY